MPTDRKSIGSEGLQQGGPGLGNDYSERRNIPDGSELNVIANKKQDQQQQKGNSNAISQDTIEDGEDNLNDGALESMYESDEDSRTDRER